MCIILVTKPLETGFLVNNVLMSTIWRICNRYIIYIYIIYIIASCDHFDDTKYSWNLMFNIKFRRLKKKYKWIKKIYWVVILSNNTNYLKINYCVWKYFFLILSNQNKNENNIFLKVFTFLDNNVGTFFISYSGEKYFQSISMYKN